LRAALGDAAAPASVGSLLEGITPEDGHRAIADSLKAGTRARSGSGP